MTSKIILLAWNVGGLILKHGGNYLQLRRTIVECIPPVFRFFAIWLCNSFHRRGGGIFFCPFTWKSYAVCFSQWDVSGRGVMKSRASIMHLVLLFAMIRRRRPCWPLSLSRRRRERWSSHLGLISWLPACARACELNKYLLYAADICSGYTIFCGYS